MVIIEELNREFQYPTYRPYMECPDCNNRSMALCYGVDAYYDTCDIILRTTCSTCGASHDLGRINFDANQYSAFETGPGPAEVDMMLDRVRTIADLTTNVNDDGEVAYMNDQLRNLTNEITQL